MSAIASILRHAEFVERLEARSGESLFWNPVTGLKVAIGAVSAADRGTLEAHGWLTAQATPLPTMLDLLRLTWPRLESLHPDQLGRVLTSSSAVDALRAVPEEERGRVARWLVARGRAMGIRGMVEAIVNSGLHVAASATAAPTIEQPTRYFIGADGRFAFSVHGNELDGYKLIAHDAQGSGFTSREDVSFDALLTPNAEWSPLDWESAAAMATAKEVSEAEFSRQPGLASSSGILHRMADRSPELVSHLASVEQGGLRYLLGEHHQQLRSQFLDAPRPAWINQICDQHNLAAEPMDNLRRLVDAWIALRTTDDEAKDFVLPAIRQARPELSEWSDDRLLSLLRESFSHVITHARRNQGFKPMPLSLRSKAPAKTDLQPDSVRAILKAHYGEGVITTLEEAGRLNIIRTSAELPAAIRAVHSADELDLITGLSVNGEVTLVSDMLVPEMVAGVFLHEVGEHAALSRMLGRDYGRLVSEFDRLLQQQDPYATWAAMRVPASTKAHNIPSERLAYLVERVSNDSAPRAGGDAGYALGQECLANLRTWLFRTPTFRWLENAGAMDDFTLTPRDIAALAREAVNFHANSIKHGVAPEMNQWKEQMGHAALDKLFASTTEQRIEFLGDMGPKETLGYLYSLVVLGAPSALETLEHFKPTLAEIAAGEIEGELQVLAGAILAESNALRTRLSLREQVDRTGFAMWVDGTAEPSTAKLNLLSRSPEQDGKWELTNYHAGLGALASQSFSDPMDAFVLAHNASFVVGDNEAPAVLRQWAGTRSPSTLLDNSAFREWFGTSQVVDERGLPLPLYHGTAASFDQFSAEHHRSQLNGKYQGDGFHFSPSADVASKYANAARNHMINKDRMYAAVEREYPGPLAELFRTVVEGGMEATEDATVEDMRSWNKAAEDAGIDFYDLLEIGKYVEGTRYGLSNSGNELFDLFNQVRHYLPEDVRDMAVALRVDDVLPNQNVVPVFLRAENVLFTEDREAARNAQSAGYDGVCYSGPDCVDGVPEWVVFSVDQIRNAITPQESQRQPVQGFSAPASSTVQESIIKWSAGTHVLSKDGSLAAVVRGDHLGAVSEGQQVYSVLGQPAGEGQDSAPAFLSIRNPWVPLSRDELTNRELLLAKKPGGFAGWLRDKGYDGIQVGPFSDGEAASWVILDEAQARIAPEAQARADLDKAAAFDAWFSGSAIKSSNGEPLVCYHGTDNDFAEFAPEGVSYFSPRWDYGHVMHKAFVLPVFLSIKNPYWAKVEADIEYIHPERLEQLKAEGYDGMIWAKPDNLLRGASGWGNDKPQIVAFYPNQIKSAVGNRGTFSGEHASILLDQALPPEQAFANWFGDSKVVNDKGEPLVVYHGTAADFSAFGTGRGAIYFTDDASIASVYGVSALEEADEDEAAANVIPAYLSIQNPLVIDEAWANENLDFDGDRDWTALDNALYDAAEAGYDGAILKGVNDYAGLDKNGQRIERPYNQYIVFRSEQIKSAIGNRGTFDPANANILFGQALQREQAFSKWFNNSKVVNESGQPLVVYHGTSSKDFDAFETYGLGSHFGPSEASEDILQLRAGVTHSYQPRSENYVENSRVVPVYLSLQNPLRVPDLGNWEVEDLLSELRLRDVLSLAEEESFRAEWDEVDLNEADGREIIRKVLAGKGYDGLVYTNTHEAKGTDAYVAFSPEQIKSAIGNRGTFDPASPSILLAQAQSREAAFNAWFQDSKAVDGKGEPLVMFHGTRADFSTFGNIGGRFESSKGYYFTTSADRASLYADSVNNLAEQWNPASPFAKAPEQGANVMPVYLQIRNPLVITQREGFESPEDTFDANGGEFVSDAERHGYDGIIFKREKGDGYDQVSAVVFRPEQIKSAIGNRGTFDPSSSNILHRDTVTVADAFAQWFEGSPVVDAGGAPMVMYHGTRSADQLTEFDLGLIDGVDRTGDLYGTAAYFTSDADDASRFAALQGGEGGAVLPVYISGNILDLDAPLSAEHQDRLSLFASAVMLPSDKARFAFGRSVQRFTNAEEARVFFERQRSVWDRVGDKMDRALPVVDKEGDEFVIHYTDFAAPARISTGEEARTLFNAIGWDNVLAAGFDGVMMTRESGAKWVALHNPHGTVKSVFNIGTFARSSADIRYELIKGRHEAFSSWFDGSKIVDSRGEPVVLFHGTNSDFGAFDQTFSGMNTGHAGSGLGIFLTAKPSLAGSYADMAARHTGEGQNVMPLYASLKSPRTYETASEFYREADQWAGREVEWRANLQAQGFDGVIVRDDFEEVIVFSPEQVKSVFNRGTFDSSSADIRYDMAASKQDALAAWFNGSKVTDADGKPMVVYHGTKDDITSFDPEKSKTNHAFFFSSNPSFASSPAYTGYVGGREKGGGNVLPLYLRIVNPLVLDSLSYNPMVEAGVIEDARNQGYDGIQVLDDGRWVAFDPSQIKSVFNRGTFDPASTDIRHAVALPREQAFGNWFGNSAAVDAGGNPLVLYHGTAKSFDQFADLWDTPIGGQNFGRKDFWHYLTPDPEEASLYAVNADKRNLYLFSQEHSARANVMPVYASIQSPMVVVPDKTLPEFDGTAWFDLNRDAMREKYQAEPFDGIVIKNRDGSIAAVATEYPSLIKSVFNRGTFDSYSDNILHSFAGENALTSPAGLLAEARILQQNGSAPEEILAATGWSQGLDGKWRFEIDDSQAQLVNLREGDDGFMWRAAPLGEILHHPQLFAAYPGLARLDANITIDPTLTVPGKGKFNRGTPATEEYFAVSPEITYTAQSVDDALKGVIHEIQHAIQEAEGFALGGSPSDFNKLDETTFKYYKAVVDIDELARENGVSPAHFAKVTAAIQPPGLAERVAGMVERGEWDRTVRYAIEAMLHPDERYMRLAGEIEARNAAARQTLTAEQRRGVLPSATEDRTPEHAIIVWGTEKFDLTGRVMADAGVQPVELATDAPTFVADALSENEAAEAKGLDMSTEARLERARQQGFDTSRVWYHGSEKAGFTSFETSGKGKTEGTGAFFTLQDYVARTYSGTRKDARVFKPEEMFENPEIADGDVEIERYWAVIDSRGRVSERFDVADYPTGEAAISANDIELEEGDLVEQRFTVYVDGNHEGDDLTREDAIEALRGARLTQPGNYQVYLRAKDIWTIDWEGRNWDQGPNETIWNAYDENGDIVDTCYSESELDAFREVHADHEIKQDENPIAENTDEAARHARECGYDAVLILNVEDGGPHSHGGEVSDVMVVFDSANIRLTSAAFDPDHTSSDDIRLRAEKAASNHQTQTQAFKQWFGGSVATSGGEPLVCYHGTGNDFTRFSGDFNWVSATPGLANDYAEMRGDLYAQQPAVMPVYIRAERPFDADLTPSHGRVIEYVREAIRQAEAAGRTVDMAAAQSALDKVLDCAYREESGPYYERHNLWNSASSYFGRDGAAEIKNLLRSLGFDSIKLTEQGQLTYGALDPQQLKSAIANTGEFDLASDDIRYQTAFHGTPFDVDQFRLDKINTGEGAQSFGWGLYFTETKAVAEFYRNTLTIERGFSYKAESGLTREEVLERVAADFPRDYLDDIVRPTGVADRIMDQIIYSPGEMEPPRQYKPGSAREAMYQELRAVIGRNPAAGNLYQVELPENAAFLFWDKPLEQQSELVQSAFKNGYGEFGRFAGMTGGAAYRTLSMEMGARQVSLMLNSLGIRGTKYLDQQHRGVGEGSYNFVIWDESAIRITAANDELAEAAQFSEASPGDAPVFFSQLLQQMKGTHPRMFRTGPQFKQWLAANSARLGVKQEELFWTGINEWLDAHPGAISKAQVLDYLETNGVQIEEVWHHDNFDIARDWEAARRDLAEGQANGLPASEIASLQREADRLGDAVAYQAVYPESTLPGGKNYRELLLTLPSVPVTSEPLTELPEQYAVVSLPGEQFGIAPVDPVLRDLFHGKAWPTADAAKAGALATLNDQRQQLALEDQEELAFRGDHWELTPNVLAHVRFNERTDEAGAKVLFIEEIQSDWGQEGRQEGFGLQQVWSIRRADGSLVRLTSDKDYAVSEAEAIGGTYTPQGFEGIPTGPFVTDTKAWVALALKRVLRYASDNAYDRIAFINGEQAVQRFGLEQGVADGLRSFYDEIVPQVARDLMKKLGTAQASSIRLGVGSEAGESQLSFPVPKAAALPMPLFSMAETKHAADFATWAAGTYAVDDAGEPLLVFRGQHGISDDVFHSRLGSLSFGDLSTAYLYATEPNERSDRVAQSRVIPAYLSITNPVIVSKDDPFISFSLIADHLGVERAVEMAKDLSEHINQYAYMIEQGSTVADLLASNPEAVRTLDADAYLVFDSPKFVEWFKEAGFDGAIHLGNGATLDAVEYKVFSPEQVLHADPLNASDLTEQGGVALPAELARTLTPEALFAQQVAPAVAPSELLQFAGNPSTANQFALERRGAPMVRPIAYGLPFKDSKAAAQHFRGKAARGNKVSTFGGAVLTAATVKSMREAPDTAPALKAFLQLHGNALVRGESAVKLVHGFVDSTRERIDELEQSLRIGAGSPAYQAALETLATEQKRTLAWLVNHAADFATSNEVSAIGVPLHTDYLDWDSALTAQSQQVRTALAKTGFDGHYEVFDAEAPESREVFMSKVEAKHYQGQLEALGIEAVLQDQFPDDHPVTTGRGAYRALSMILGGDQQASQHLQLLGVPGIRHMTEQGSTSYIVFQDGREEESPQAAARILESQVGTSQAQLRLPLASLEGVSVGLGLHRARIELAREAGQQRQRAKERHAELSARLEWCRGIPNIDPRIVQGTEQGIAAAQAVRASLSSWKVPSTSNTMPWDQPIGKVLAEKINSIVRVDAEKMHGQQAFYYLASTLGSNGKAQAALRRAGIIGAHEGDSLVLWDGASKSLAEVINAGADLERFHLAYHGTSQQIDNFSLDHVGEGEGAQAYGYGLYFTQRKAVAGKYQANQVRQAHWYEDRLYKSADDMANAVAPEIAAKHPHLAGDVAGINQLESAVRRTIHAACYNSLERVEARLAALDDATRDICRNVVQGIHPVTEAQKGRFFLMPPGGARALNAMSEDELIGLAEITESVNWKLRPEMTEDQMQEALAETLMRACDETLWITQLAKIEQRLLDKPQDDYLLSRKGDLLAGQRMAQQAQACVRVASPLSIESPLGFGSVYLVDISIQPMQYLRFDLPFKDQSGFVQKALLAACEDNRLDMPKRVALHAAIQANDSGAMLHGAVAGRCRESAPVAARLEDEIMASKVLLDAGIQGIQYPDGEISISGQGFNFVVFDDSRISVLGHTSKLVTSEYDEVPVYDWADTDSLELAQLNRLTLR